MENIKTEISSDSEVGINCFLCSKFTFQSNVSHDQMKLFLTSWAKFVNSNFESTDKLDGDIKICDNCLPICTSFCEDYKQWNLLQLRVEWNLKQIIGMARSAGYFPEKGEQGQLSNKSLTTDDSISNCRDTLLEKSVQKLARSSPQLVIDPLASLQNVAHFDSTPIWPLPNPDIKTEPPDLVDNFVDVQDESFCSVESNEADTRLDSSDDDEDNNLQEPKGDNKCPICKIKLYKCNLKKHLSSHQISGLPPNRIFKCQHCSVPFSKKSSLAVHLRRIHGHLSTNICPVCQTPFSMLKNLRKHMRNLHPNHNPDPFLCNILNCTKRFTLKTQLERHQETCEQEQRKAFTCPLCQKVFKDKDTLDSHHRFVHRESNIVCKECGKSFQFNIMLNRHIETCHQTPKTCVCPKCKKGFTDAERLRKHLQATCVDRKFVCGECGKSYKTQGVLNYHTACAHVPKSDWKWECEKCQKKFPDKWVLRKHMVSHRKGKPYSCNFCEVKCKTPRSLREHVKRKHNIEEIIK